jgi:hypothetical protein
LSKTLPFFFNKICPFLGCEESGVASILRCSRLR